MEMRSSPTRSTTPELNSGESVSSSGRGATLSSGKAPRPAHGERGWVRWLGTGGVVENKGERNGDGFQRRTRALARTRCNERASFYSRALRGSNASCVRREEGR
jgi:hypothetical protein